MEFTLFPQLSLENISKYQVEYLEKIRLIYKRTGGGGKELCFSFDFLRRINIFISV